MPFADFVNMLSDPGYLATSMMWFIIAYIVALKATPPWQVSAGLFLVIFILGQWSDKTYWSISLGWSYIAWIGFIFQKAGGGTRLRRSTRRIRRRFRRWLKLSKTPQASPSSRSRPKHKRRRKYQTEEPFSQQQRTSPEPPPKPSEKAPPWWEILEVSRTATKSEVKKAYRKLVHKFHPDKVLHLGEEFQKIAEERTQEINSAFSEAKSTFKESASR